MPSRLGLVNFVVVWARWALAGAGGRWRARANSSGRLATVSDGRCRFRKWAAADSGRVAASGRPSVASGVVRGQLKMQVRRVGGGRWAVVDPAQ